MKLVQTESFELATIERGDSNAPQLALLLPGRLDTKDYVNNPAHMEFLAGLGFYAVSFDPPGTWESPGNTRLFTTTNYIQAINELIQCFGDRPTLLMGHSRGGTVAMLAGPNNPHVTHMVAVNSGYGSPGLEGNPKQAKMTTTSLRDLPPGSSRTEQKKELQLHADYFIDGEKYNALDELSKCTKPKLFFYSTGDDLISEATVRTMYDAAAQPKMIHGLNTEHDYRLHPEIIEEVNQVLGQFLDNSKTNP